MQSCFKFIATLFSIATWVLTFPGPIGVTPARAASTITVDTTDNQVGNDGVCALHEAVINANDDAQTHVDCVAGSGADTIVFADSLGTATVTYLEGGGSVTDPDGLTIDGGGDITVSGANIYQVFVVSSGAALTVTNLTIANGSTAANGGGIANYGGALTVTNSVFSGNRATTGSGWGGALYNNGTAVITDSSFTGNIATFYEGGAVYNAASGVLSISNSSFSGNGSPSVAAGAISNHGTATVSASAFSGNVAGTGGALYNVDGTLTVVNSTLTGNSAVLGGGIYSTQSGGTASLTVINSTIASNTGGGGVNVAGATTFKNTLVANNTGGNCSGTLTNGGNNLDDGITCGWGSTSGSMSSTDPQLGTLTGSPAYFPLDFDSPAIDWGDAATCAAAPVNNQDQRGQARDDLRCDIGAFELKFADSAIVQQSIPIAGPYTFGPTMIRLVVNDTGGCLTGVNIRRYNVNHPSATVPLQTGHWWKITPIGCVTGFNVNLTLPTDFIPDADDKVCRWNPGGPGSQWDCALSSSTFSSITRDGVTAFSQWAAGDEVGPTAVRLNRLTARGSDTSAGLPVFGGLIALASVSAVILRRRRTR